MGKREREERRNVRGGERRRKKKKKERGSDQEKMKGRREREGREGETDKLLTGQTGTNSVANPSRGGSTNSFPLGEHGMAASRERGGGAGLVKLGRRRGMSVSCVSTADMAGLFGVDVIGGFMATAFLYWPVNVEAAEVVTTAVLADCSFMPALRRNVIMPAAIEAQPILEEYFPSRIAIREEVYHIHCITSFKVMRAAAKAAWTLLLTAHSWRLLLYLRPPDICH